MIGLPFALVALAILVWSVVLLVGTLGSMSEADESDETSR